MNIEKDFNFMTEAEKVQLYVNYMKPIVDKNALFADGSDFYRTYTKTEKGYHVRLRFRTRRHNVDSVFVATDTLNKRMTFSYNDHLFDYYEVELDYPECGTEYCYVVRSGKIQVYYNKRGALDSNHYYYNFKFKPQFQTPDWAKGAVFYQIYVDRFRNGDPSNDVVDREYCYIKEHAVAEKDWNACPTKMDVRRFYGGDLQGVLDKLDYLQELGVEVLYLNPIFVSPSNHKYDIQDYDYIDPHFGKIVNDGGEVLEEDDFDNRHATKYIRRVTDKANLEASNEFFIHFVEEVHRRGMKIILDGVFNHCGSFNKWLDRECIYEFNPNYEKGAYVAEDSPYNSFFKFHTKCWPYNSDYDGWWDHNTLPKLNYENSQKLYDYIMRIGRKWVSPPYNVDGWRLDVAADLGQTLDYNHSFWKDFRKNVKEANPNALILAENYTDPASWLQGDEWDTVMNYEAFMDPITWFLTGVEKHSDEFRGDLLNDDESFKDAMSHHMSRFTRESLYVAMNELSNHDHSRFLTRTNGKVGRIATKGPEAAEAGVNKAIMREAVVMQMTWPGAPTVYYGDEAGVCGWTDPDNRRTYPWGHEDMELIRFHKEAIRIHKESSALRTGSLKMLKTKKGVLSYGRFDLQQRYLTVINNLDEEAQINIPVWQIGTPDMHCYESLLFSDEKSFCKGDFYKRVENGLLSVKIPARSAMILREVAEQNLDY